jgi:hypothetical protein
MIAEASPGQRREPLRWDDTAALAAALVVWVAVLPRLVPGLDLDRGIFVSVAERLLAGDRLYDQVFDNKEPVFYYLLAAQRALGPWAEVGAELIWVLIASISAYAAARQISGRRASAIVGFVATPVILTGAFYEPGYTHLPGVAMTLAVYALVTRGYSKLSGACLGALFFLKITLFPVALSLVAVRLALQGRLRPALQLGATAIAAAVVVAVVLAARGELEPFATSLMANIAYSQGSLIDASTIPGALVAHLGRASGSNTTLVLVVILLNLALALLLRPTDPAVSRALTQDILAASISLLASLGILAATALWSHHNQIIYVPAVLSAVCLSAPLDRALARFGTFAGLLICLGLAWIAAGVPRLDSYVPNPSVTAARFARLGTISPEARQLLAAAGNSGSYARLGRNDDEGHAAGLRSWSLACPRFHQYPFEPEDTLRAVLDCASRAPFLLIGQSVSPQEGWPAWNRFVAATEELLGSSYRCGPPTPAEDGVRVCRRRVQ